MDTNYILQLIIQAKDEYSTQLKKVESELEGIKKTTQEVGNKSSQVVSFIKSSIAKLGLTALIAKTTKSIVGLADNLEKAQIAFTTMLGSEEKAVAMLNQLSDFAKRTPFEITGIRESAQQLIAMGVNANDIIPTLKSLGDVSAGLSVPLSRLALNYGQVIAQGKLTGRELRDFTMAGVPLLEELSNQLGKTTTQIQDMISKGQITSNDVIQAFQNMTSEGGRFSDLMGKQATTLSGMRSNFQDSLTQLGEQIGSELLPTLKGYMNSMSEWLDSNIDNIKALASEVVTTAKVVADNIIGLIGTLGGVLTDFASFVNSISGGIAEGTAQSMSDSSQVTAQGLTGMAGNRHDFFYYIQQGITAIAKSIQTVLNMADSLAKTVGKKSRREGLYKAGETAQGSLLNVYKRNSEGKLELSGKEFVKTPLLQQIKNSYNGMKEYIKTSTKEVKNTREKSSDDLVKSLEDNYVNQVAKIQSQTYSINKTAIDGIKQFTINANTAITSALGDGSGSGSGSSAKKAVEEVDDGLKDLIKEMEEYAKETISMKEATYEGIIDSMEEAVKTAEKLSDEIVGLQDKIAELNREEEVDIAKKYVEAEEKLRSMEREYENISQYAREYADILDEYKSGDELGGFKVKDLEEYLMLQKELTSAYSGLSDEQKKALDEQIEKQKEYNSLTDIEKIRADYEEKRAELQQELDEKVQLLNEEIAKYEELSDKKVEYEKEWLDYMNYSYKQQRDMYSKLISQAERLAELKAQAGLGGIDRRAGGGVVYSGNAYLVGEYGPELFTPSQRGMITPNNQITNNNGIEINISGVSVRNDDDIQSLADEIVRKIKLEKQFGIN